MGDAHLAKASRICLGPLGGSSREGREGVATEQTTMIQARPHMLVFAKVLRL
jgi:hypothetical protein